MPQPLSRTEYAQSRRQWAALKLWFAWHWLRNHPEETFDRVVRERIDLIRMTPYFDPARMSGDHPDFDIPAWLELEAELVALHADHAADADAGGFVEAGVARLAPVFEENQDAAFAAAVAAPDMKCGSITYHHPDPADPGCIAIHIANALRPRSPFDDPRYLPECLLAAMDRAAGEFGVSRLHCGTWLNSHPRWLALFPAEWQERLSPPDGDIRWHFGFWGQFVTARGAFHEKNADAFRSTGAMPFPFRTSQCSFAALRDHLQALLNRRT